VSSRGRPHLDRSDDAPHRELTADSNRAVLHEDGRSTLAER
jgi:hypothetical protein